VRTGQIRHLLISSPNENLIQSIFSYIKENLIPCQEIVNIGEQQYHIQDLGILDTKVTGKRCVVRTSTPISVRIPEIAYDIYNINEDDRKQKFLYWRSNLSHDIFLNLILNNMKSKYKEFHGVDTESVESAIKLAVLLKEVVIHLPIDDYTLKIPASFWRFYFDGLDTEQRSFLNFALDTGIGERNSAGLGFLNAEEGASIVQVAKA
jgi:CRISPR-associated endoribonuclease Cas6